MKELIERIECAEGESLPLFFEACQAAFPSLRSREHSVEECEKSDLRIYRFRRMIDAEAWLSAAEMLVPAHATYVEIEICARGTPEQHCRASIEWLIGEDDERRFAGFAATPALALAAAALKARGE